MTMKTTQLTRGTTVSMKPENSTRSYYAPTSLYIAGARILMRALSAMSLNGAARVALRMFSTPHTRPWNRVVPEIFQTAGQYFLTTPHGRIKLYGWGESGPRVLLVHGWESRAFTFASIIPLLLSQGFRVVAMDGPAHGESSGRTTNLVEFGEAVQAVVDNYELAGGLNRIIAHSFGAAAVAFQFSTRNNTTSAENIVLVSMPTNMREIIQVFSHTLGVNEEVVKRMTSLIETRVGVGIDRLDLGPRFGLMRADRILSVHDHSDLVVASSHLDSIDPYLLNHQFLLTNDLGHNHILKDPRTVHAIVKFLGKGHPQNSASYAESSMKLEMAG